MRILHVISGISREGGGPSRSVQGLVAGLNAAGVEACLMTLNHGDEPWVEGVTHFINGEPFEDVVLRIKPDAVHLHGIWSFELHRCAVICRRWGVSYIIAPRGMLEPWSLKQKWLKKRIARCVYQDRDLKCAAALHATAESEAEQFRKLGFKNPIIISPNGVNVPKNFSRVASFAEATVAEEHVERVEGNNGSPPPKYRPLTEVVETVAKHQAAGFSPSTTDGSVTYSDVERKGMLNKKNHRVLFVSRMHPKKGVMELVEAWGKLVKVKGEGEDEVKVRGEGEDGWVCELVYTVNGDFEREYEAKVKTRVKELGLEDQFIFTGALNDDEKWRAYARADLFVLPTYSENFGIVVAEALWAGVPVITTKGTPWGELETAKCGKWIDLPTEGSNPSAWPVLVAALREMMSLSDGERREMGEHGRSLVEVKYTWNAVVKAMVKGYEAILQEK